MADTINISDDESDPMSGVWMRADRKERNETQSAACKTQSSEESASDSQRTLSLGEFSPLRTLKRQDPEAPSPEEERSKKCAKPTATACFLPETGYEDLGFCSPGDYKMKQLASCTHSAEKWLKAKKMAKAKTVKGGKHMMNMLRHCVMLQTENYIEVAQLSDHPTVGRFDWSTIEEANQKMPNNLTQENTPRIKVHKGDALHAAYKASSAKEGAKVAVLRMTQDCQSAKSLVQQKGCANQDGDMFRRTDLSRIIDVCIDLFPKGKTTMRPDECLTHQDVTIFRGPEDKGYPFLKSPRKVHVIAAAALNKPRLTADHVYCDPRQKTQMERKCFVILGAAAKMGVTHLILSAFGCGNCQNPPKLVAQMFLKAMKTFPIPTVEICVHECAKSSNSGANFEAFRACFKDSPFD